MHILRKFFFSRRAAEVAKTFGIGTIDLTLNITVRIKQVSECIHKKQHIDLYDYSPLRNARGVPSHLNCAESYSDSFIYV